MHLEGQSEPGALAAGIRPVRFWSRWARRFHRMDEAPFGLLLLVPAGALLILITLFPIVYAVVTSFRQVELTISAERPWVGLRNYRETLTDRLLWESLVRTVWFATVTVGVGTSVAMLTALTLNEKFFGRSLARVVILLPWAVASLVAGVMWQYLFNGRFGVVNAVLRELGLIDSYVDWLADPNRALVIAGIGTAWKHVPFLALMLLASMQSVPEALYRSAKMDGANVWHRFRVITFPHLRGIFAIVVVYQIVSALLTFDLIYGFTKGGPGYGTTVVNYLIYLEAFQRLSLGMASAMSLLLTFLIIAISGLSLVVISGGRRRA